MASLFLSACAVQGAQHEPAARVSPVPTDSVFGRAEISHQRETGKEVLVYLTRPGAGKAFTFDAFETLRDMREMEVMVFGTWITARRDVMSVVRVVVRSWAGEPAFDGILRRGRKGDYLEFADGGRARIMRLPAGLHGIDGQRVVLAGSISIPTRGKVIGPGSTGTVP